MDSDRLVIVTGGSRGVGRAIALRLAADGHDVVLGYRFGEERAEHVAAEIHEMGRRAIAVPVNVTDEHAVAALFVRARELGRVTGVVNSAGLAGPSGELVDLNLEMTRKVIEVNLLGTLTTAKIAAREMTGRGGSIVNTATAASTIGKPGRQSFNAIATAMIEGLTRSLAKELADAGIRVNAVAPGDDGGADDREVGLPKVAEVVAWLLSDAAAETSGIVIRVAPDA